MTHILSPGESHRLPISQLGDLLQQTVTTLRTCSISREEALHQFEKRWIEQALLENRGNLIKTARALNLHRNTLRRRMQILGITPSFVRAAKSSALKRAEAATAATLGEGGHGESPEPSCGKLEAATLVAPHDDAARADRAISVRPARAAVPATRRQA